MSHEGSPGAAVMNLKVVAAGEEPLVNEVHAFLSMN